MLLDHRLIIDMTSLWSYINDVGEGLVLLPAGRTRGLLSPRKTNHQTQLSVFSYGRQHISLISCWKRCFMSDKVGLSRQIERFDYVDLHHHVILSVPDCV